MIPKVVNFGLIGCNNVFFYTLNIGDVFIHHKQIYVKIETYRAMNLESRLEKNLGVIAICLVPFDDGCLIWNKKIKKDDWVV